jgi:hypothetical protein
MKKKIAIVNKFNNSKTAKSPRYIWVYANGDLSENHPEVLDWKSGLENLKQLQKEPIKKKNLIKKNDDNKEKSCGCQIKITQLDGVNDEILSIRDMLKKLKIMEPVDMLDSLLATKNITYLTKAIDMTKESDLISYYKLYKIAEKLKNI